MKFDFILDKNNESKKEISFLPLIYHTSNFQWQTQHNKVFLVDLLYFRKETVLQAASKLLIFTFQLGKYCVVLRIRQ